MKKGIWIVVMTIMIMCFGACDKTEVEKESGSKEYLKEEEGEKEENVVKEYNIDDFLLVYEEIEEKAYDAIEYAVSEEEMNEKFMAAMIEGIRAAGFEKEDTLIISGKLYMSDGYPDGVYLSIYDGKPLEEGEYVSDYDAFIDDTKAILIPEDTIVKVQVQVDDEGLFGNEKLLYPDLTDFDYESNITDIAPYSLRHQVVYGEVIEIAEVLDKSEIMEIVNNTNREDEEEFYRNMYYSTHLITLSDDAENVICCLIDAEDRQIFKVGDKIGVHGKVEHYNDVPYIYVTRGYYVFGK